MDFKPISSGTKDFHPYSNTCDPMRSKFIPFYLLLTYYKFPYQSSKFMANAGSTRSKRMSTFLVDKVRESTRKKHNTNLHFEF